MTSRGDFSTSDPPAEWTLADLLSTFVRRRNWVLATLLGFVALALIYWACATPRYRATAEIEIQRESHGAFGLDNTTTDKPATEISDSFEENLTLQTEIGILKSDAVALDVIQRSSLERTPDYFAQNADHSGWVKKLPRQLFFWRKPLEPLAVPLADAPNRRYLALKTFARRRKIAVAAGTRLISISYSDPDPARAVAVVDALIQSLAGYSFRSRSAAAAQSATWLEEQLEGLKRQTDALDARAAVLDRQAGDYGDDPAHNVVLARLDTLNTALSEAESARIVREAIWRAVQGGDGQVISGLGGNPASGPNTQNSFALLQSLRTQEATEESELAESAKRYGENWPAVAEQRARLGAIEKAIQEEVHHLSDRAHSDYQISLQAENEARTAFNQQKKLASSLTGNAVALRLTRQEADESRALYTSLLGRLQQAGVLEGLHSDNFVVASPALVPSPDHPASPNLPLLMSAALAAGVTLGCTAAVIRELTDDTIHAAADIEGLLDAPVFAVIPRSCNPASWHHRIPGQRSPALIPIDCAGAGGAIAAPQTPMFESLHCLRASLLISHSNQAPQVIMISAPDAVRHSPDPPRAEGQTASVSLGLAAVLAQQGSTVLHVDADLRSARGSSGAAEPGLSQLLANDSLPASASAVPRIPGLSVLAAGPRPPCPSELIASSRMATMMEVWRQDYDFIVVQSPASVYADALVLAQLSDAVLLRTRAGITKRNSLLTAFHALSRQIPDHAVLGLILEEGAVAGLPYARA